MKSKHLPSVVSTKSNGFSLIEVLIALGVMSLAALAGSQLIMNLLASQKAIAIDSRMQDILNESKMAFKNPTVCSANIANFSSKNLSSSNMGTLKITVDKWTLNGAEFLKNNSPIPGASADTKVSLSIEKFEQIATDEYKAFAIFNFDRGNVPGGNLRTRQLPMNLLTTSGVITSCSFSSIEMLSQHDLDNLKSEICTSFGGTFDTVNQKCSSAAPSKQAVCTSLGGTYNTTTEKCSLSSTIAGQIAAIGGCSPGFVATGVDASGKVTCTHQASATTTVNLSGGGGSSTSITSISSSSSTATAPKNCPGGSFSKTSPNGSNTCFYSYPGAGPYQTVTGTATVGAISGTCQSDGTWTYSYICPDKTGTTCDGGVKTWYSLSGQTACTCSYDQATEGQTKSGTCNTGSVTGACTAGGWSFSYSCKDPNVITCPGGTGVIGSTKTPGKTCNCVYNTTAAGSNSSVSCTNGGSISGTCNSSGQWVNVVSSCP